MKQKIKVYTHDLKIEYKDDLVKVVKYFKDKVNLDIEFMESEETPVHLKDTPPLLYLPNDGKHSDLLMYMFDRYNEGQPGSLAFPFSKNMCVMQISTSTHDDKVDYTWKLIAHEIMHTFFQKLRLMGTNLEDPMDGMLVNGVWSPYYKNQDPLATDGNFAEAFKRLAPHWDKLYPPSQENYFKTQEFVSKAIYQQWGEKSLWFVDPKLIDLMNFTRKFFGRGITINNWLWNGNLTQRGFREPTTTTGASLSQHRFGRGCDFSVSGLSPSQVYNTVLANEKAFIEAGLTTIEDIKDTPFHVHFDIRHTGLNEILVVPA